MTTAETSSSLAAVREAIERLDWGRHDEAIVICEGLLRETPDCAEALYLLGLVSFDLDEPVQAIKLMERAHEANPELQEAAEALAAINAKLGRVQESLYYAKLGTILEPHGEIEGLLPPRLGSFFGNLRQGRPDLYLKRARRQQRLGETEAAIADCETQLELTPGDPESLRLLRDLCRESGRAERAIAAAHALLHLDVPAAADLSQLALALDLAGRHEEAEACHGSACAGAPDDARLHARLLDHLARRPAAAATLAEAQRDWYRRHAQLEPRPAPRRAPWRDERPLRVGYLCGSFRDCDLMRFFEPVLRSHDTAKVEAHCYADGGRADAVTERLMRAAHRWTDLDRIDDETAWQILQGDEIDIAVDLSGQAPGGRPLLLARRPAPVALAWLVNLVPPDAGGFDRVLTDGVAWPEDDACAPDDAPPLRLAPGQLAYRPLALLPEPGQLPAAQSGQVTFGVQGDLRHIDTATVGAWAAALARVPGARLLICNRHNQDQSCIARVLDCVSHLGLRQRCDIVNHADNFRTEFDFYAHVDLALDWGAAESAVEVCRALWMGVPVLALAGTTPVARRAASVLTLAGRAEWIATDPAALGEIAFRLTRDRAALAALRQALRAESEASPLADVQGFTRSLEAAYAALFKAWEERGG
ncbi:MAG: CDC27 family protein [Kiloniellales bacterium]|nr:CDC27 family protein [Kiloniellales bacterium]